MRWPMILATVSLATCLGASAPQAGKSDQDAIQGVWQAVGGEKQGKALTKEFVNENGFQLEFKGGNLTFRNGKEERPGTFKLDPTKNPKQIDLTEGSDGIVRKAIYELSGDELRICANDDASAVERPSDFKTTERSSTHVVFLKRVKK